MTILWPLMLTFILCAAPLLASSQLSVRYSSSVKDDQSTINDLPHPILKCVETQDGAVVADGRVKLTVGKDQFAQLSVQIVQMDQFSGDSVLGIFLTVQKITPNQNPLDFDARRPDLIYRAKEDGKQMLLSLWNNDATPNTSVGKLVLTTDGSQRLVYLSCRG